MEPHVSSPSPCFHKENIEVQHPLEQGLTNTEPKSAQVHETVASCSFSQKRRHAVGSCPLWTYSRISSSAAAAALCGGKVYV